MMMMMMMMKMMMVTIGWLTGWLSMVSVLMSPREIMRAETPQSFIGQAWGNQSKNLDVFSGDRQAEVTP